MGGFTTTPLSASLPQVIAKLWQCSEVVSALYFQIFRPVCLTSWLYTSMHFCFPELSEADFQISAFSGNDQIPLAVHMVVSGGLVAQLRFHVALAHEYFHVAVHVSNPKEK